MPASSTSPPFKPENNEALLANWQVTVYASRHAGHIGLWWADGETIYIYTHEVEDGKNYDGNLHPVMNHEKAWRQVVLKHRPDLKGYSYTYLPRGRVFFHVTSQRYIVVGTPQLISRGRFLTALEAEFLIAQGLTVSHEADDHYSGDMLSDIATTLRTISAWQ